LLSLQFQHSPNAAAVTVAAVVAAGSMAEEAVASMVAEVEASMAAVDFLVVARADFVVAASLAVRGLLEEVTTKAAGLKVIAIPARAEIIRRMFVPQSMMASGIRSATPVVPRV